MDITCHWAGQSNVRVLCKDLLDDLSVSNYDVVWADFCCPISVDAVKIIKNYLLRQKRGVFACSFLYGREHCPEEILNYFNATNLREVRETLFPKLIESETRFKSSRTPYQYKSEIHPNGVPMITHMFTLK
jgi:hypothetical protein